MNLTISRYHFGDTSTLGLLSVDGDFHCYTLEDPYRGPGLVKIPGETCIPEGRYRILLRTEGGFHTRYRSRFPDFHKGMLWLQDVPGFEWILIHCGNDSGDTKGCPLVGHSTQIVSGGLVGYSVPAYRKLYPLVAAAILDDQEVWIDVTSHHPSD